MATIQQIIRKSRERRERRTKHRRNRRKEKIEARRKPEKRRSLKRKMGKGSFFKK